MKYIVQFFREIEGGFLKGPDSLLEFQVIFSARSEKDANKKGMSIFKKWVKNDG